MHRGSEVGGGVGTSGGTALTAKRNPSFFLQVHPSHSSLRDPFSAPYLSLDTAMSMPFSVRAAILSPFCTTSVSNSSCELPLANPLPAPSLSDRRRVSSCLCNYMPHLPRRRLQHPERHASVGNVDGLFLSVQAVWARVGGTLDAHLYRQLEEVLKLKFKVALARL